MKKRARKTVGMAFLCASCMLFGAALAVLWLGREADLPDAPQIEAAPPPEAEEVPEMEADPALDVGAAPAEGLYVSEARAAYESGTMRLIIPKLEVDVPILGDVKATTLRQGEGLYDQSQLPIEENGNVSIAGHRNGVIGGRVIDSRPFYYINTLTEGDYLYLRDSEHIYQYQWQCTEVIKPTDWSPIYNQGYSCVTLTTCTPIGISDHRLVVRGELVNTLPLDEAYTYPASTAEG